MAPKAAPRWDENAKHWIMQAQIDGVRKSFYSSKPGRNGQNEVKRKVSLWKENKDDKSDWPLDKCWTLFLEDVKERTGLSENYIQHEKYGRLYILPQLKLKKVSNISEQDWQNCINKAKPTRVAALSQKTLKNIRGSITAFCRFAKKSNMISPDNVPTDLLIPTKAKKIGKNILQPEDIKALFAPSEDWYINSWRLMVLTGLRPGECYGLQKRDIKGSYVTVRRSINRLSEETTGKNDNARRTIKLNQKAMAVVNDQLERLENKGFEGDWLFPSPKGEQLVPERSYKHWRSFAQKAGIDASPYCLRHTFVSVAKRTLPDGFMKSYVGHSEDMDTFGVYSKEVDGDMESAANLLDQAFNFLVQVTDNC